MKNEPVRWAGWVRRGVGLSAIGAIAATATPLAAQSVWVDPGRHQGVWLEVLRPEFDSDIADLFEDEPSFISSATFLGGRLAVSPRLNVVAELPFAYGDLEHAELVGNRATIGNPYLGVEWLPRPALAIEAGIRAPLADDESFGTVVGLLTEFPTRTEAFLTDYVPIGATASYDIRLDDRLSLRLRGGPSVWLATGDLELGDGEVLELDSELLATYGGQLWYRAPRWDVGGGLMGRAALTEDGDFGERTVHQLGLAGNLALGRFVPGLQFRVPLDEDDGVDFVAGLNLAVRMK